MIGFWSVFHVIVNLQDSISDLPFPKRKQPSFTCVWMVVSVGPKSLGVVTLTFSFLFSRSFQCTIDSLTPSSATVSNFVLSANAHVLLLLIQSSLLAQSVAIVSRRFHDCATSHLCFHHVLLHRPSLILKLAWIATISFEDAFQGVDHRIRSFIADPSHGSLHIIGNHFIDKWQTRLYPDFSWPFCRFLHKSTHVSSVCLLHRKRRDTVLVSHLLIFSEVCMVQ